MRGCVAREASGGEVAAGVGEVAVVPLGEGVGQLGVAGAGGELAERAQGVESLVMGGQTAEEASERPAGLLSGAASRGAGAADEDDEQGEGECVQAGLGEREESLEGRGGESEVTGKAGG